MGPTQGVQGNGTSFAYPSGPPQSQQGCKAMVCLWSDATMDIRPWARRVRTEAVRSHAVEEQSPPVLPLALRNARTP
jgi:hypothetical protein